MVEILSPSLPPLGDIAAYALGGGLSVAGSALLAWGRQLGRGLMMLAAGAGGYVLAVTLADKFAYMPPMVRQVVFIFVMMGFGFVFERVLWAAVLAGVLAAAAAAIKLPVVIVTGGYDDRPAINDFAVSLWNALVSAVPHSLQDVPFVVLAPAVGGAALILAVAVVKPRWVRIVMVSLIGSCLLAAGLAMIVCQIAPRYWLELWRHVEYVGAGVGAGAVGHDRAIRGTLKIEGEEGRQKRGGRKAARDR